MPGKQATTGGAAAEAQPTQQKLMVWVPANTHRAFRLHAVQTGTTVSDLIREALIAKYPALMRAA